MAIEYDTAYMYLAASLLLLSPRRVKLVLNLCTCLCNRKATSNILVIDNIRPHTVL